MSKRLIMVLALAFVVGFTCAAYAEVQNVKVSGDITAYGISQHDFGLTKQGPRNKTALATIARVRVDADLTDMVTATVRLLNERYWGAAGFVGDPNDPIVEGDDGSDTSIDIDLAYVTLKEFLYSPLTLMVGRQELHYGNEMVVGDPDTNALATNLSGFGAVQFGNSALSARKAFDAIRAILDYDPLVVDVVMAKIREGALKENDDTNLYGINAAYKVDDNTSAEAYWWTKRTQRKDVFDPAGPSKTGVVHTVGARLGNTNTNHDVDLRTSLEGALQFGKYNDGTYVSSIGAYALEGALTAGFKNVKYTPSATLLGAIFSGKKDPADFENDHLAYGKMRGWDPMFENQKFGDIANQAMPQTNTRIIGVLANMMPAEDVILSGEYYAYWADRAYTEDDELELLTGESVFMTGKKFLGSELDLKVVYNYTEDVQFGLLCGMYFPGSALHEDNDHTASEVIGSMKVLF